MKVVRIALVGALSASLLVAGNAGAAPKLACKLIADGGR